MTSERPRWPGWTVAQVDVFTLSNNSAAIREFRTRPSVDGSRTRLVAVLGQPPMSKLPVALAAIDYISIVKQSSPVELGVLALLVAVSVVSWALIGVKAIQLSRAREQSITFLDTFWKGSRLDAIYQTARNLPSSPISRVFIAGYEELSKLAQSKDGQENAMSDRLGGIENVERALNRASTSQITELESRVSFLGTVGATAPFVGLFGTVMGILSAFNEIADKGNASLTTVAAPIGNALVATAAGLFAAIPAVVAYNSFVSRIKVFDNEMANFSSDFLNIIKRHFFK
jgi:biopolymer transport protein TolQ